MSKKILFLILFSLPLFVQGQKLVDEIKKKHFGVYRGVIPAFSMDTGRDLVDVTSVEIIVEVEAEKVVLHIGDQHLVGDYKVLFKGDDYYVLDVTLKRQLQHERLVIKQKGKMMTREGIYPQPNSTLKKLTNKEIKKLNLP